MIRGLHHAAYRCRDSEETRRFYEDFLGLPLSYALEIGTTKSGRSANVLHTFYEMGDGSFIAFFEEPEAPFDFRNQRDFDLHLAQEVDVDTLNALMERGRAAGMNPRGVSDHGFIHSIYFRDPNGYVVELAARVAEPPEDLPARAVLDRWQRNKPAPATAM